MNNLSLCDFRRLSTLVITVEVIAPNEAAAQEFRVKKSEMAIATPEVMSTLDMFFVHEQKTSLESL